MLASLAPLDHYLLAGGIQPCRGEPVTYASSVTWFGVDCVVILKVNGGGWREFWVSLLDMVVTLAK